MTHRICVVTQSDAFAASAGMRIRYDRFREGAVGRDVTIVARPIADVMAAPFDADVYVFCKTFTPAALLLAAILRRAGKIVGQDFFDDYFSQTDDQRLFQYRAWLRQMAPLTDFAMCTTPRMREVLQPYLPQCPITLVEDPIVAFDPARVGTLVSRKQARMRTSGRLRLAWFGIGDNPFFPVGLDDLTAPAVATALGRLRSAGWDVGLTVATNLRALDVAGLARLRTLPVAVDLLEWSESVERAVLIDADVALLPVGSQDFSRAKSLNRALTAFEQGCQVLSIGEPLYQPLDTFLYRDVDMLAADLRRDTPRLRRLTVAALGSRLESLANVYASSDAFVAATRAAVPLDIVPRGDAAIVHGIATSGDLHDIALRNGGLSIATPFTKADWNFPVRFDLVEGRLRLRVAADVSDRHALPTQGDPDAADGMLVVDPVVTGLAAVLPRLAIPSRPIDDLVAYPRLMAAIVAICRRLFPDTVVLLADTAPVQPAVAGVTA